MDLRILYAVQWRYGAIDRYQVPPRPAAIHKARLFQFDRQILEKVYRQDHIEHLQPGTKHQSPDTVHHAVILHGHVLCPAGKAYGSHDRSFYDRTVLE